MEKKVEIIRELEERVSGGKIAVLCRCFCGNEFTCRKNQIRQSCGCLRIGDKAGRYNNFVALEPSGRKSSNGKYFWTCLCDCGTIFEVCTDKLNKKGSCGCLNIIDKRGRYDNFEVLERIDKKDRYNNHYWKCLCDCGTIFYVRGGQLKKRESCGCILKEKNIAMCKARIGENHPNWNHDITDEERELSNHRSNLESVTFSKSVFIRDNYTCQVCGVRGGVVLNAHHLDGYHWCKEKRSDIDNGVTLCEGCHSNFHTCYGRRFNTKEQFTEYLASRNI